LSPAYTWANQFVGNNPANYAGPETTGRILRNREYYRDNVNQVAQTDATSPFDGSITIGMGFGTLANRPTACTTGTAYWVENQGNWNTNNATIPASGLSGFTQGQLYICNSNGAWPTSASYVPYTYPHPLVGNSAASVPTFSPVAGTFSTPQNVTISTTSPGAIICWNTSGALVAPQTNGSTGCATGTLYTGPVSVSSSKTLYAVAGGTGYLDSPVSGASYTITQVPAPATKLMIQVY
jgi:hypothetical protein